MFLSPLIYLSLEYLTGGTRWLRGPGPPDRSRLTQSLSESKLEIIIQIQRYISIFILLLQC